MVARTLIKAGINYAKKKAGVNLAKKKARILKAMKERKSVRPYNIQGGTGKGPVPIKNQSLQKSTLSGRTYSISSNKLSSKTMLNIGGGYGTTPTARFQDNVKDLIGLDSTSIKMSQRKLFKRKKKK